MPQVKSKLNRKVRQVLVGAQRVPEGKHSDLVAEFLEAKLQKKIVEVNASALVEIDRLERQLLTSQEVLILMLKEWAPTPVGNKGTKTLINGLIKEVLKRGK